MFHIGLLFICQIVLIWDLHHRLVDHFIEQMTTEVPTIISTLVFHGLILHMEVLHKN
jgi:hypothetical protein